MKNIHIGYGDSATGCLKEAIEKYGLVGDGALPSRDDFTQGPISDALTPGGLVQRIAYWQSVDQMLGGRFDPDTFYRESIAILDKIEADELTIWVGDSCHDILATAWLISYLGEDRFDWYIVDLAEVVAEGSTLKNPVVNLAMYRPQDLKDLYGYRRPMNDSDKEYYHSVWNKAAKENSPYRIKEGNEIVSVDKDYYDEFILSFVQNDFLPTRKIIGDILRDGSKGISDTTVECNIRKMVSQSVLEYEGSFVDMASYSIRKRSNQ